MTNKYRQRQCENEVSHQDYYGEHRGSCFGPDIESAPLCGPRVMNVSGMLTIRGSGVLNVFAVGGQGGGGFEEIWGNYSNSTSMVST